ncbi:MAG TPA: hypothetical protein VEI08_03550, partial [Candidatus Bathyarchaeia archaeon]|nr:hypothetical protein [Candidatus Bathyarchaeia archaeon]
MIIRNHLRNLAIAAAALGLVSSPARPATPRAAQQSQQPSYTLPEYNAEQAAASEKDPQQRIKLLDAFVAQFPNSTLLQYIYQFYYQSYYPLKNYAKAVEYCDKLVDLGDKADLATRVPAIQARVQLFPLAYLKPDNDQLTKDRDVANLGIKLYPDLKKVPGSTVTDDQIKAGILYLQGAVGQISMQLKDYPTAIDSFKAVLAANNKDAVSN